MFFSGKGPRLRSPFIYFLTRGNWLWERIEGSVIYIIVTEDILPGFQGEKFWTNLKFLKYCENNFISVLVQKILLPNPFMSVFQAYIDGGQADSSWESNARIGLHTDGAVNDPNSNSNNCISLHI